MGKMELSIHLPPAAVAQEDSGGLDEVDSPDTSPQPSAQEVEFMQRASKKLEASTFWQRLRNSMPSKAEDVLATAVKAAMKEHRRLSNSHLLVEDESGRDNTDEYPKQEPQTEKLEPSNQYSVEEKIQGEKPDEKPDEKTDEEPDEKPTRLQNAKCH